MAAARVAAARVAAARVTAAREAAARAVVRAVAAGAAAGVAAAFPVRESVAAQHVPHLIPAFTRPGAFVCASQARHEGHAHIRYPSCTGADWRVTGGHLSCEPKLTSYKVARLASTRRRPPRLRGYQTHRAPYWGTERRSVFSVRCTDSDGRIRCPRRGSRKDQVYSDPPTAVRAHYGALPCGLPWA